MKVLSSSRSTSGWVVVESFSQHLGPVDIVGSGHRVDSFARVTLDGLSKNHAMTFIYPATTRRAMRSGPTHTPPWWTQPVFGEQFAAGAGSVGVSGEVRDFGIAHEAIDNRSGDNVVEETRSPHRPTETLDATIMKPS